MGGKPTDEWGIHGYDNSLDLCLPPLSLMVFKHDPKRSFTPSGVETETGTDTASQSV
jgi:1,4-alpha-glucan branching enzyme